MCLFEVRAARRREYERRAFVAHKLLLLQPQQIVVVRLGSLCSSSHTTKTSLSSLIYKHKFACFCRAGALVCVVQATAPCCWPRLAHKAQWHGFQPICIANAPNAVRCLQRTSDCYEVNRVSVSPRGASAVVSLSRGNGGMGGVKQHIQ